MFKLGLSNAKERDITMENLNMDIIANGKSYGEVANYMAANGRIDAGQKKPFLAQDKRGNWGVYCTIYKGGDPKKKESFRTIQMNSFNANAGDVLRRDEWKQLDTAILEPSRYRLGGVEDLVSNGLVYNLGNGMGTTVLEWHDVSEAGEAILTMDAVTRGKNDRPVFQYNYLPIPIIHSDYEINARELAVSRNMGNGLDTT